MTLRFPEHPTLAPFGGDKGRALRAALEPTERALWELNNPGLPWDITLEESLRVVVVNGRATLHPEDAERRVSTSQLIAAE